MRPFLALLLSFAFAWASLDVPEAPPREFRGMWIATVGNIDWPSKPGLPVAQQQTELRALLDLAKASRFNVVVFQVRTAADAFYDSPLEPWSEYLTGRMGEAPRPRWDPLQFACAEAHERGLELHAWINPYRARYHGAKSPIARSHVSRAHPDWMIPHGRYLWTDPGNPAAQAHTLKVVADLVRRYDVDGFHIDDYFYPYPDGGAGDGAVRPFQDQASYGRYRQRGGRLEVGDWRRQNVNEMVERLEDTVHGTKPWVKFGVSPFGIWRPNHPAGIKGLDQFGVLYADARLWINRGWADYFAPQLYWPMNRREQDFTALLGWWSEQNSHRRILVPGLASASIGKDRPVDDVANQVRTARSRRADGVLFWNASSLRLNKGGVRDRLAELFRERALVPATPWLGTNAPAAPQLRVESLAGGAAVEVVWRFGGSPEPPRQVVLQTRVASEWRTEVLPATSPGRRFDVRLGKTVPDEIRIQGIGRTGMAGEFATWTKPTALVPAGRN
jgi:uncharacterized lipoprotein YddW (UPF0748 family)